MCAACVCVGAKAQTRRVGGVLGSHGFLCGFPGAHGFPKGFPAQEITLEGSYNRRKTANDIISIPPTATAKQNCRVQNSRTANDNISIPLLILILGRGPLPAAARYSASPAGSQLLRPARGRSRGSRRGIPSLKRVRQPLRISAPKASKGRSQEIRGGATRPVLRRPYVPEP